MTDQKIFIAGYFPDEESEKAGIKRVATAFNAKDIERAKAKANFIFLEEYEYAQDAAFKILVCEDTPDVPGRPSRGTWNEDFLYEYDWPEDIGHPVKRQAEKVDFDKLSRKLQIAALIKYGSTELTKNDLPSALEITQDDDSFEGHMYAAIIKTPEVANMFHEHFENAIGWLAAKCDHTAKWPEIQKELANWKKRHDGERKQTGSSKSVVDIAREKATAEKLRQQNEKPVHLQDEESLKRNIALGLVAKAMDFDILNPPASIVNRARDIIKLKEKPFPAWFAAMSATLGIYEYSTVQIIYSVKIAPEDIDKTAGSIQAHINRTFTETDHANPSAEMLAIACGTQKHNEVQDNETTQNEAGATDPLDTSASTAGAVEPERNRNDSATGPQETAASVERTGPFYYRSATGDKIGRANKLPKLQEVIAQGCVEISQEEYQARKTGSYKEQPATAEQPTAQPEFKKIADGIFSVDSLMAEQPKAPTTAERSANSDEVKNTEIADNETTSSFTSRAEVLTKELNEKTGDAATNLSIWKRVHKTDPARTKTKITYGNKRDASGNLEILRVTTSINPTYQEQRATELFGPFGIGWGVDIVEERFDPGIPFMEPVYDGNGKFLGKSPMRNADGSIITTVNHTIRINLWYIHNGAKGNIPAYGHTKYIYQTKSGATCDDEFAKKSLTDATTKALSKLGFSADVYTGLFDDSEYKEENAAIFDLRNASEKAEEVGQARKELDERFKVNIESMRCAPTPNEVSEIASSLTRVMGIHLKSARAKADKEYEKYLDGRLRRLEEIKTECLTKLQEKAA